jgi:hypothetical protein
MTRVLTAGCLLLCAAAAAARAEDEGPKPVHVALRPAAAPSPALRYRLLPDLREQKPADAAAGPYKRAVALLQKLGGNVGGEQLDQWQETPLGELPRDEIRRTLAEYREALGLVEQGARCERCDWGVAERLRQKGIGALLPELQPMREAARLLAVRARLEMAEGRLDDAARTLQTGFAVARQVGEEPTLINALVGVAVATVMARQVDQFVQCERAPNLYWALTDLPRPFIDLRVPLQGERLGIYGTFPGLADAAGDLNAGPLSPRQVQECVKMLFGVLEEQDTPAKRVALAMLIRAKHETAKRALVARGRPRALVEKMPHVQVALLHALGEHERLLDEAVKWQGFPYWEAQPGLARARRQLAEAKTRAVLPTGDAPVLPLAPLLVPATEKVFAARTRLDRKVAALRCVEAVRLYAAGHGGQLPPTLRAIREVPVPVDPATGKGFEYRAAGGRATLSGPPPAGQKPDQSNSLSYELALTR